MTAARTAESPLSQLRKGATGVVASVGGASDGTIDTMLERRLLEFGFVHGERFEIVAEAQPGRDPFVVRIGSTTIALRRREAAVVRVRPDVAPTIGAAIMQAV